MQSISSNPNEGLSSCACYERESIIIDDGITDLGELAKYKKYTISINISRKYKKQNTSPFMTLEKLEPRKAKDYCSV